MMGRRTSSTLLAVLGAVLCGFFLFGYIHRADVYVKRADHHDKKHATLPGEAPAFNNGVSTDCSRDDFSPSTVNVYNWSKQPNTSYNCPNMKISEESVKPMICVYPPENDIYISKVIINTGIFERDLVEFYVSKLLKNPDLGVIDVGANIGVYTVLAAAMGRQVVSIEPMPQNAAHLHASVVINDFQSKVTLLHNALSDCRGQVIMRLARHINQGAVRVNGVIMDKGYEVITHSIMLSDITPYVKVKRVYLKMDIEGYEHRALARLPDLLRKVEIPFIQMEWHFLRKYCNLDQLSEDFILVEQFVHQLTIMGYAPYDTKGRKLDVANKASWTIGTLIWMTQDAL